MNRSTTTTAIIVSLKAQGENNSTVTLITPDRGIVFATLYGGPKSKMRSLVAQWNIGKIWLYETPEKNQIKISDFEVTNYHPSFNQNLFKIYAANLAGELAIKTRCAGSNEQCFTLLCGFLNGMELCDEEQSRLGLIRFLWRYLELLGVQPTAHSCGYCGHSFLDSVFTSTDISYYNNVDNTFVCNNCTHEGIPIKSQAVQYLAAVTVLSPSEVRKLQIDKESFEQIKNIVFFLIENNIDQKLNSIETGLGIL